MIKKIIKKSLGIDAFADVQPLKKLRHVGSNLHGYHVPENFLTKDSICYCIGAGEDISFDTELKVLYDPKIFIFDPTPEGINYFKKLKENTAKGIKMQVIEDNDFFYRTTSKQLDEMVFVEKGVYDKETVLKFYAPKFDNYVSHSVYLFKDSGEYIEAPVDRMSSFMKQFGHKTVDLVKMEIEGAEYVVLDSIVQDKLDVKVILVEFDEVFHAKGLAHKFRIKKACEQLKNAGYVVAHSTDIFKRTFIRQDVYDQLKAKEKR